MPDRLSVMRARATSLVLASAAMALVLAAPVVALGGQVGAHAASAPAGVTVYRRSGIDVSHWQGRIDWQQVADAGIDFAIIKATDGMDQVDPWYLRNRDRAQQVGILTTAYHFARPGLSGQGSRQTRIVRRCTERRHGPSCVTRTWTVTTSSRRSTWSAPADCHPANCGRGR